MRDHASSFKIRTSALICHQDGVIAYPTESVFGLGCHPLSFSATEKLLQLKQRPIEKGLILIAADLDQLQPYITLSKKELEQLTSKQNLPTTWLVNPSDLTPFWVTGQHKKVAVRISKHPVVKQLCNQLCSPLISTSANPAGKPAARTLLKSRIYFGEDVDYYVAGATGNLKNPSRIIDCETGKIIRQS